MAFSEKTGPFAPLVPSPLCRSYPIAPQGPPFPARNRDIRWTLPGWARDIWPLGSGPGPAQPPFIPQAEATCHGPGQASDETWPATVPRLPETDPSPHHTERCPRGQEVLTSMLSLEVRGRSRAHKCHSIALAICLQCQHHGGGFERSIWILFPSGAFPQLGHPF